MLTTPKSQQKQTQRNKAYNSARFVYFDIPAVKNMAYQTVKSHHSEVEWN